MASQPGGELKREFRPINMDCTALLPFEMMHRPVSETQNSSLYRSTIAQDEECSRGSDSALCHGGWNLLGRSQG